MKGVVLQTPKDYGLPYPSWRPGQLEAIEEITYSPVNANFLSAPTSFGKSGVGFALSRALGNATILTSTKQLANQYLRDWPMLDEMKGRANYPCLMEEGKTAANAKCTLKDHRFLCPISEPYVVARDRYIRSSAAVTNYDYYMLSNMRNGGFVIADEAHTLEHHLSAHTDVHMPGKDLPDINLNDVPAWQAWAAGYANQLEIAMILSGDEALQPKIDKIRGFATSNIPWVMEPNWQGISAKALWPRDSFHKLFGRKYGRLLLMSATFMDYAKYAEITGIPEPYGIIELDSNIPVSQRMLYYCPLLHMSHANPESEVKITDTVDRLLSAYYPLPALVHTQNYKTAKLIMENSRYKYAMATHTMGNREQIFSDYASGSGFRVLVSPSLGLGVDFPNIQGLNIIVKYPFPNSSERLVAARMKADPEWYAAVTAADLSQEYGRGSRVVGHVADTWIIDDNHERMYNRHSRLYPKFVREALRDIPIDMFTSFIARRGDIVRKAHNV